MRLPYSTRSKVNRCVGRSSSALLTATTWVLIGGVWRTEDQRFVIVKDDKYGLVIAEIINPVRR
jgi:hypothetical protein